MISYVRVHAHLAKHNKKVGYICTCNQVHDLMLNLSNINIMTLIPRYILTKGCFEQLTS